MGGEPEVSSSPNSVTPPPCEECDENPWKYRCPGCSIRTCSLTCVKSHKQRTACTGQRSRTHAVPLSQFDDNSLLSDYNFLEDAKRAAEAARQMRCVFGGQPGGPSWRRGRFGGQPSFKLPFKLRMLRNAAVRRRARLLLQPTGMSKREKNQSRYDQRTKSIFWTIEWHLHSTNVILTDHGVDERLNLMSIMEKHLKPTPWNHQLRPFCNEKLDNLKFFLEKNPKDSKSQFRELNVTVPIGQQMEGITLVEYPIIFIFLPTHIYDFEVDVPKRSFHVNVKNEEHQHSPKSILFEEEPDDASSDTRILDLMDYTDSEQYGKFQIAKCNAHPERNATTPSDVVPRSRAGISMAVSGVNGTACDHEAETTNANCSDDPLKTSIGAEFDFEQDLRDVYSDLVGEINPDDFLCLDGDYGEDLEIEENNSVGGYSRRGLGEDELEEGEIRDC